MSPEITVRIPYSVFGKTMPVALDVFADFNWHASDPAAVRITFNWSPTESVDWIIGRELLKEGITSFLNLGEGDVKIRSMSAHQCMITLRSPDGHAIVVFDTRPVEDFLNATEREVAINSNTEDERLDVWVDLALAKLLEDPS